VTPWQWEAAISWDTSHRLYPRRLPQSHCTDSVSFAAAGSSRNNGQTIKTKVHCRPAAGRASTPLSDRRRQLDNRKGWHGRIFNKRTGHVGATDTHRQHSTWLPPHLHGQRNWTALRACEASTQPADNLSAAVMCGRNHTKMCRHSQQKHNVTSDSRQVPHGTTNDAHRRLTSRF